MVDYFRPGMLGWVIENLSAKDFICSDRRSLVDNAISGTVMEIIFINYLFLSRPNYQ
ncbi:MAG: hypothetical protein MK289_17595 [Trichodesmium sp. ALOHA_ZT_67]|nr:hypothetical protein [Trichodesmium sp. ALOHA_ZT_67]